VIKFASWPKFAYTIAGVKGARRSPLYKSHTNNRTDSDQHTQNVAKQKRALKKFDTCEDLEGYYSWMDRGNRVII
jgi:hypothetical protein